MCADQADQEPITAFDDIPREGQEPASHLIGQFDYLNASGRPEAARCGDWSMRGSSTIPPLTARI